MLENGLYELNGYTSAFRNISTIVLIRRLQLSMDYSVWNIRGMDRKWDELKDLAISRLQGSSAGGPKKLKTVTILHGKNIVPVLEMEEIVV